jgi:predicted RNA methylase
LQISHLDCKFLTWIANFSPGLQISHLDCKFLTWIASFSRGSQISHLDCKFLQEFAEFYTSLGLTSLWGDSPDPLTTKTTFNARTYLQPQLNKAVKMSDKMAKGDHNPKV